MEPGILNFALPNNLTESANPAVWWSQTNSTLPFIFAWILSESSFQPIVSLISHFIQWLILWYFAGILWRHYVDEEKDKNCKLPLPLGDYGMPFIGESFALFRNSVEFYDERVRKYGNLFKTHILGRPTIRIVGHENVRAMMQQEHCLTKFEWPASVRKMLGPNSLVSALPDVYKARKRAIVSAFEAHTNVNFAATGQSLIRKALREWRNQGDILVFQKCLDLATSHGVRLILGPFFPVTEDFVDILTTFCANVISLPVDFIPGTQLSRGLEARRKLVVVLREHLEQLRSEGFGDQAASIDDNTCVMQIFLDNAESGNGLTDDEIIDCCLEMLFASHDTTSSALCSMVYQLTKHPQIVAQVRQELAEFNLDDATDPDSRTDIDEKLLSRLTYVTAVVKETLRVNPPVGGAFRRVKQTFALDGYQIPRGWAVVYSIKNTHDKSSLFDPDFRPERWAELTTDQVRYHYMPFGVGSHSCPGRNRALQFLRAFLVELARDCDWQLTGVQPPKFVSKPVPSPVDGLPARFSTRSREAAI